MSRVSLGWRLIKSSMGVMRADRSLIVFPLLAIVCAWFAFTIIAAVGAGVANAAHFGWLVLPFLLLAAYVATWLVVYFNVALAGAAGASIDGRDVTVAEGIRLAGGLRRQIAVWALVQVGFGLLVSAIAAVFNDGTSSRGGNLVAGFSVAAWSVASFFVIPIIAFEGLGARAALDRSRELVTHRWGVALSGKGAIGLVVFLIAIIPVGGLFVLADTLGRSGATAGAAGAVAAFLAMVVAFAMGSGLGIVFRVELYRYGTEAKLTGGFKHEDVVAALGLQRA